MTSENTCKKCGQNLPPGANFCPTCGKATGPQPRTPKKRGNGTGSVFKTESGKYLAIVTLGYYIDENGRRHRRTRSRVYDRKSDAVNALPKLLTDDRKELKKQITFKQLYDQWLPTHKAGPQTIACYTAAAKHFSDIYHLRISEIELDDLQECLDACPAGKRTRENMRAVISLMYKYGIPRHVIPENLNLSPFLTVTGDGAAKRESFTEEQIKKIRAASGTVAYADYITIMIYTGFRPSEFLSLTVGDYDAKRSCFVGGAKTDAGRGRCVTTSPKIKSLVGQICASDGASEDSPLFPDANGKQWSLTKFTESAFYPALEQIGIENPMVEIAGGKLRHKYTPHTCRHTFSTLMKRVAGSDKDKLSLIGHTSGEMLRYYQDVSLDDLQAITDKL